MDYLKEAEKAIDYLKQSEAEYAALKAQHQALKERIKTTKASQYLDTQAKTQKEREMTAESSTEYITAIADWEECLESFYYIEARRKRAELTIEMYRSVNSAMKRGNI